MTNPTHNEPKTGANTALVRLRERGATDTDAHG